MNGLGDLVARDMQVKVLKKIFDFNGMKFGKGEMGAANGIAPDGKIVTTNEQVQEVWTGTTFSVAALMLSDGLKDEGYRTAWGVYHTTYETQGYWFRTPEAWDESGHYRTSMYMRLAAILARAVTAPPTYNFFSTATQKSKAKPCICVLFHSVLNSWVLGNLPRGAAIPSRLH